MSDSSRVCKRVRIYLDRRDDDQALALQCLEALDELSSSDRNQWFVNALLDYQSKIAASDYQADSLVEMRHQMVARFLAGEPVTNQLSGRAGSDKQEGELSDRNSPERTISKPSDNARETDARPTIEHKESESNRHEPATPASNEKSMSTTPSQDSSPVERHSAESTADQSSAPSPLFGRLAAIMG